MTGDRAVLFKLLRDWSPSSIASVSTARPEWAKSTGWGTRIAIGHWYGVRTQYVNEDGADVERVTAMVLPLNGLCGKCGYYSSRRGRSILSVLLRVFGWRVFVFRLL